MKDGLADRLQRAIAPLQLLEAEGVGGMGEIYLARDPHLRRTLAVKVLRPELSSDEEARERFLREARVVAALSHPNVVGIHTVGELEDGTPFFVMDYIDGGSFADRIGAAGSLGVAEVRRVLGEVASALEAAHATGVVHRDIKASNVLFDRASGRALVTDWGIAAMDPAAELSPELRLTRTGTVIGSPLYMSPEQLSGDDVGPETDLYSLGLLAFELLTKQGPFAAETPSAIMVAHLRDEAPRLSLLRDDVDPELDALVARCLEKTPTDRPTAGEMARLAPGAGATIEWPPPGLESLRGRAYRTALWLGLPVFMVAAPLSVMLILGADPWPLPVVALVSTLLLLVGCVWHGGEVAYALAQAIRLGYHWRTIAEVFCDWRGDTGLLVSGGREYAILESAERGQLRRRRIGQGIAVTLSALFLLPVVVLFVGVATVMNWWVVYWWAMLAGGIAIYLAVQRFLSEPKRLKVARASFARSRRSGRHVDTLVESWHQAAEASGARALRPSRPNWLVPASVAGATLAALAIVAVIGSVLAAGQVMLVRSWAPTMTATLDRWQRVAPLLDLRGPSDPAVGPAEAGELIRTIAEWQDPEGEWRGPRPTQATVDGSMLVGGGPLRPPYELTLSDSLIEIAARGLRPDESAYLAGFGGDPRFGSFERAAGAAAMDWYASDTPGPDVIPALEPIPSWRGLQEVAYHKVAHAAYLTAVGDTEQAEAALRDVVSIGALLLDGTDLFTTLVGLVIARAGLDFLADLYLVVGRDTEAERIRSALLFDAAEAPGSLEVEDLLGATAAPASDPSRARDEALLELYRGAADTTLARGLRWTYLYQLVPWTVCGDPRNLLLGTAPELDTYLETLRPTLVKYPSEEPLFDALTQQVERIQAALPDVLGTVAGPGGSFEAGLVRWMLVPATLFRNPRLAGCTGFLLGSL